MYVYLSYMAAKVGIDSMCSLRIKARCTNQPHKGKLLVYNLLLLL